MSDRPGLSRFAARGHHRLAYEVVPADQDDAPTVVLLHGLLAGRGEWAEVRAALAGAHRLVLPEGRGHGASAALSDRRYSLVDAAAETLAVLNHADADRLRLHLVGHGLGGAIAWEISRVASDQVASLTLVEPDLPALLDDALDPQAGSLRRDERQAARAAADAAYKGLIDQALDAYGAPRLGPDWRSRAPRPVQATYRRHAAALPALLDALDGYEPSSISPEAVSRFLIVRGSAGRPIVRLVADRLAAAMPHARFETVPTNSPFDSPLTAAAGERLAHLVRLMVNDPPAPAGPGLIG